MKENIISLIERAQNGDIEAFGDLVRNFQDAVFGLSYAVVKNFHDAEEVAQEAFLLAYQELSKLREREKFPGWLHRITITACNRFLRSRKMTYQEISTAADMPGNIPGQDVVVEGMDLQDQILREINALSEKNRMITTLYFINRYSYKEIGDFLEIPVSTVKSRLHKSRSKLQGRLTEMVAEVLNENKPGKEFIQQLRRKLHGQIIELPDGCVQVFYDFIDEKQLQDWRQDDIYRSAPKVKEGGLAFGRIEPEETENQWDRDIRCNLVFDPNLHIDMEIEYDVIMGTSEPWSDVAWALTRKDGTGQGICFFYAALTNYSDEWYKRPGEERMFGEGYIRGDFLRRFIGDSPGNAIWINPTQPVLLLSRTTRKSLGMVESYAGKLIAR